MKLKKPKPDTDVKTPEKEEVIPPQAEIIEADLYKRSYFGPDVPTLELECWEEELSEVQLQAYKNADDEYKNIQSKLDDMVKDTGGQIVYNGDQFTAYQLLGKQPVLKDLERQSAEIIRSRSRSLSISKEKPNKRGRPRRNRTEDRDYSPSPIREKSPEVKKKKKKDKEKKEKDKDKDKDKDKENTKTKDKTLAPSNVHSVVTNVRPSEATAIGGLLTGSATKTTAIVDLTKDENNKNIADSREVSFNKLQGKTFPSLVVVARPYLRAKDSAPPSDRAALDSKVKSVLMHTPMKFTEWLIQQGLVRSEQWCVIHNGNKLKLGMYSDVSKFPYSGGYVWISECCPTRFVSVYSSSIFEGATFPPSVLLKLIYHWACQTNVQNVVQWVKVDNLYVKGLFTWLRAVCTSAIHQHMGLLGGAGKKVEVGVISLGTTSHDGTQRQVKVEVLGVLDAVEKIIRLRAVEPLAEHEKNYKKRFQKILEPLTNWVHPSSVILTDLTVDKGTLVSMGFKNVHQSSSHSDQPGRNTNANIMEYLRRIVPRMFQNTLSLLSRQIIQQFLDELVWREIYGISPGQAFDNIVIHISQQTKMESKDPITVRLNKIAANPFKNWKYPSGKSKKEKAEEPEPETGRSKRGRKKKEPSPSPPPKKKKKEKTTYIEDDDEEIPLAQSRKTKIKEEKDKVKDKKEEVSARGRRKQVRSYVDDDLDDIPLKNIKKEAAPQETVSMERYYFGQKGGDSVGEKMTIAVECPVCHIEFNDNYLLMTHLYGHAVPSADGTDTPQCTYCLTRFPAQEELDTHLKHNHPADTKSPDLFTYACLICEVRFAAVLTLASHMQKTHAPLELPYECGACEYRVSSHRAVADHFRTKHSLSHSVFCPYCLKVIKVYADGYELTANVILYLDHLKQHQDKEMEVRCNRCVLTFVHLGQLKEHQVRDHVTVEGATPLCSEEHLITKPRNKARPPVKDSASHTISETFEGLTLVLPEDGMLCRECDTPLERDKHFLGTTSCSKCSYVSSCYRAMLRHSGYCAGPHSLEDAPRAAPHRTYCVCGYNTNIGTDMLTHLLMCEHKSAYRSEEEARNNTVRSADDPPALPAISKPVEETPAVDTPVESVPPVADYAPPSVLNTQLSLDDLAPPSVLQSDQHDQELRTDITDAYDHPLATPRHEEPHYSLGDFEPLPQEPPPQPDFEQL
ncbi:zinc finger domain-containing protein relative of woc [Anticarsia gemmatalis]|uniref:zinc finger domain-containing protein relative of woc n=1 Tax=Anticarsia gemmatalis TaxID=129554 RepID=UPI003F75B591